jgi:hypothetical protein
MISPKAPAHLPELGLPSRIPGLLSLLMASPMALLGCTPDEPPVDDEGSSSGSTGAGSTSTGVADSTSTDGGSTSTGSTSGSSTGTTDGTTMGVVDTSATTEISTSSGGTTSESTDGGESTSTGGEQGNTCDRVGDLFDMCGGGGYYYNYYEYSCNNYINYYISIGDIECAQAHNEIYACIADLSCVELGMGAYFHCEAQYDNMQDICYDWGDTFGESDFGEDDFGGSFIVFGTSDGGFIGGSSDGGFGST